MKAFWVASETDLQFLSFIKLWKWGVNLEVELVGMWKESVVPDTLAFAKINMIIDVNVLTNPCKQKSSRW
jgi:hypothetical protein